MPSNPSEIWRRAFPTAHRLLLERFVFRHLPSVTGDVLVLGAGHDPYGKLITKDANVCRTDVDPTCSGIDAVADAHALPFEESKFDNVLALEVFEHLERPSVAAQEMYRVLKQGGCAIISVPFMFRVHGDPQDYTRFTKSGLKVLFQSFEAVEIVEFGSRLHVVSDILTTGAKFLAGFRVLNHLVARTFLGDLVSKDCPSGYWVMAKK